MPSFLSKVFLRKKTDEKDEPKRRSQPSLLEGKFEAVTTPTSPSANTLIDPALSRKEKEKDGASGLTLFRTKSPQTSNRPTAMAIPEMQFLTLNLSTPKGEEKRERVELGVAFEASTDGQIALDGAVLGAKRLSPMETLVLVRACSEILAQRGLETLGVMHPHWHSASVLAQRKLISLFILSLSQNPITTLSPTPSAPASSFESELGYTRSPHDVAAVLRWGLRHLKLERDTFGKQPSVEWDWYTRFADSERSSSYPQKAFSEILIPELLPIHVELLSATLDLVSSLASHAEYNGISGSKLSKFLGLWLLTGNRSEETDDWPTFYSRWERAGRTLEHLFLSRIRDEAATNKIPKRLMELVQHYPYPKQASPTDDGLLPRPRFSTRRYDALYVRVNTEFSTPRETKIRPHPLRLIEDALKSEFTAPATIPKDQDEESDASYARLWDEVKRAAITPRDTEEQLQPYSATAAASNPVLSRIFSDETMRLLSLVPSEGADKAAPTAVTMFTQHTVRAASAPRDRSVSVDNAVDPNSKGKGKAPENGLNGHGKNGAAVTEDWLQFSSSGFGETPIGTNFAATLLDNEVEVTAPPPKRKPSKSQKTTPTTRSRRSSVDNPNPAPTPVPRAVPLKTATVSVQLAQLDEAFIDFYSDAELDTISSTWPAFVLCQLKPLPGIQAGEKPISWLVIEQLFSTAAPDVPTTLQVPPPPRASSPRPSFKSDLLTGAGERMSSTLSSTRKRFTFFGGSDSKLSAKKAPKTTKSPKVGELGEILSEAEEKTDAETATKTVTLKVQDVEPEKGEGVQTAAAVVTAASVTNVNEPTGAGADKGTTTVDAEEETLPAAPKSVVVAGETPGPQLALSSSEPEALVDIATRIVPEAEIQPTTYSSVTAQQLPVLEETVVEEPAGVTPSQIPEVKEQPSKLEVENTPAPTEPAAESGIARDAFASRFIEHVHSTPELLSPAAVEEAKTSEVEHPPDGSTVIVIEEVVEPEPLPPVVEEPVAKDKAVEEPVASIASIDVPFEEELPGSAPEVEEAPVANIEESGNPEEITLEHAAPETIAADKGVTDPVVTEETIESEQIVEGKEENGVDLLVEDAAPPVSEEEPTTVDDAVQNGSADTSADIHAEVSPAEVPSSAEESTTQEDTLEDPVRNGNVDISPDLPSETPTDPIEAVSSTEIPEEVPIPEPTAQDSAPEEKVDHEATA